MTTTRAATGMCFDRTFPAGLVTEMARRLDAGGADQLWVIEDCFYTAGVSLAAAALTVTERLQVGLGILPAVARNAAVTAMEIATLCSLAPGRVLPGIGHGVQPWMAAMGALTPSPLTTLEEVIVAVTRLDHGAQLLDIPFRGRRALNRRRRNLDRRSRLQHPRAPLPRRRLRGERIASLAAPTPEGREEANPDCHDSEDCHQ